MGRPFVGPRRTAGLPTRAGSHRPNLSDFNPNWAWQLRDSHAVAVESGPEGSPIALWFACHQAVYRVACTDLESLATIADLEAYRCWQAPFGVESLAIGSLGVYATCYAREKILLLDPGTGELIQEWPAPGIGREHLMLRDQALWVSDRTEETLFVLDPKTCRELARILSPWPHPTGIAMWRDQIWVAAATREDYIYDSPNDPIPLSVDNRPKTWWPPAADGSQRCAALVQSHHCCPRLGCW
ncbi:MAG: hypothetical protein HC818_06070 [Synechococcaceae cyanobacterium RM1_1_27]|nr:hypothetical protein [Synechococcaceae cyanobacterium RM1_1_27]